MPSIAYHANWHFLAGAVPEIRRICYMFGVDFWPDEVELMHSLHTAIIDQQEKLAVNLERNQFTVSQLGDLVQSLWSRHARSSFFRKQNL
jgi:hypothetical protein